MVGIQYTEITNLSGSETEGVWANIQCDKQLLALGVMYRPPSANNAYLKSMLNRIDNVFSYHENILLTIINSTSLFVPITHKLKYIWYATTNQSLYPGYIDHVHSY